MLGSVLMIGAHPDDENTAVISYLARGRKIRTGYLSLTRGEGGQNLLGNEQSEYLGALRTQELLAARRWMALRSTLRGQSISGSPRLLPETLEKWGHDKMLSDIVWVIRQQQPDVILLCFTGTPADGHGQHQVSAILGREAFDAAADPTKFPGTVEVGETVAGAAGDAGSVYSARRRGWCTGRQRARGGSGAWLRRRVVAELRVVERWARAASWAGRDRRFSLPVGDYDPVLGKSYREIAVSSRSQHKSQAMVQTTAYGEQSTVLVPSRRRAGEERSDGRRRHYVEPVPGGARVGELLARRAARF